MSKLPLVGTLALAACASAAAAADRPTFIVVEAVPRLTTAPLRVITGPVEPVRTAPVLGRFPMAVALADPAQFPMPIFGGRSGVYLTPVIPPAAQQPGPSVPVTPSMAPESPGR